MNHQNFIDLCFDSVPCFYCISWLPFSNCDKCVHSLGYDMVVLGIVMLEEFDNPFI